MPVRLQVVTLGRRGEWHRQPVDLNVDSSPASVGEILVAIAASRVAEQKHTTEDVRTLLTAERLVDMLSRGTVVSNSQPHGPVRREQPDQTTLAHRIKTAFADGLVKVAIDGIAVTDLTQTFPETGVADLTIVSLVALKGR